MVAIFLVVGIVLFLGFQLKRRRETAKLAQLRAQREQELALIEAQKQKELVTYVVPIEVIPKRTTITDRMVHVVSIEKSMAPWSNEEERKTYPASVDQVVGRIAMVRLAVQEPVRKERLAAKDDLRAVSFIIEQGKRAVTIPIDLIRGVGGFIRQGDFVDVMASFQIPGGQSITKAILRKVRILIVDKTYVKDRTAKDDSEDEDLEEKPKEPQPGVPQSSTQAYANLGMVTFEVTPAEAEKLVLASNKLPLTLVLRNPTDPKEDNEDSTVTVDRDIFVDDSQLTVEPEQVGEVEVILGATKQVREVGVQ
jgi:pilus assembly protein CpaB